MRNRRWWAMSIVTVVLAVACSNTPATPAPASRAPTSAAPGSTAPGTTAPGSTAPGTTAPGSAAPGSAAPGSAAPGSEAPASEPASQPPASEGPPSPAVPTVPTGYAELDQALTPGSDGTMPFAGKKVNIQVQWTGGELTSFTSSMADFQKATGITINI